MKYILNLKDYVTKLDSAEKDYNENFYRYNILDYNDMKIATVWFAQMEDSGNIYSVSVRLIDTYDKFNIYINTGRDEYYPQGYQVNVYQNCFSNDKEVKEHLKNIQLVNLIAHTIMDIFREKEHIQKYLKGRRM